MFVCFKGASWAQSLIGSIMNRCIYLIMQTYNHTDHLQGWSQQRKGDFFFLPVWQSNWALIHKTGHVSKHGLQLVLHNIWTTPKYRYINLIPKVRYILTIPISCICALLFSWLQYYSFKKRKQRFEGKVQWNHTHNWLLFQTSTWFCDESIHASVFSVFL